MYNLLSFCLTRLMRSLKDGQSNRRQSINYLDDDDDDLIVHIFTDFSGSFLKYLPLRTLSRLWGFLTSLKIPIFMRSIIIGCYSRLFNCNLDEAELQDYKQYTCLKEFFRRSLKPGLRPIFPGDCLVSNNYSSHFFIN